MLPVDDFGGQGLFAPGQAPAMPQVPQMKHGGGMFGSGGVGRNIAGMIGDFLMARAGMQPIYAQTMMQRRERADRDQEYQRHRQDDNADYVTHLQLKQQFDPPQPGEFEQRLMASGVQPGTPEWTQAMKAAVQNTTDPIVITPQGPMLRSQVMGALQQPEILQTLPPGAKPLGAGGPASPAPGGFPY